MSEEDLQATIDALRPYDTGDLLASIGGLRLVPRNAERGLRLDLLAQAAVSLSIDATNPRVSLKKLRQICNTEFLSGTFQMEDPTENPFTESVTFFGGNYVVLAGLAEEATYVHNRLAYAIFVADASFGRSRFGGEAYKLIGGMLRLSHEIARRAGLRRGVEASRDPNRRVAVPKAMEMTELKRAVTFSEEEISELLEPLGVTSDDLVPLIIECGSISQTDLEVPASTLSLRPIVRVGTNLIVADPTSLLFAVRHHVLNLASQRHVLEKLTELYCDSVWHDVCESLQFLGHQKLEMNVGTRDKEKCLQQGLFSLDSDKVVFAVLVTDQLETLEDEAFGTWPTEGLPERLEERARAAERTLMRMDGAPNEVLVLFLYQSLGRSLVMGFGELAPPLRSPRLPISASEFRIIAEVEGGNQLLLLKYAKAGERIRDHTKVLAFSQLDEFYLYRSKGSSYHMGDDGQPDLLSIAPGTGTQLRLEAQQKRDWHAVRSFDGDHLAEVTSLHDDARVPIYICPAYFGIATAFYLEALPVGVWVIGDQKQDLGPAASAILRQLCELICYWLWQFAPELSPTITSRQETERPLVLRLIFDDIEGWEEDTDGTTDASITESIECNTQDEYHLDIHVRPALRSLLVGPDNVGERKFMAQVLGALGRFVERLHLDLKIDLPESKVGEILDRHAPIGPKKMMILYDVSMQPQLDDRQLPRKRLVQDADTSDLQDEIGAALTEQGVSVGLVESEEQGEILQSVVGFLYQELESLVTTVRRDELLDALVAMNEALVQDNAHIDLTIATRKACYGEFYDIVEQVMKEQSNLNGAAVASRFAIEYVSACPGDGTRPFSLSIYDRILALSSQIVNWGFAGDLVYLGIVDAKLAFTKSGRLALDMGGYMEGRLAFLQQAYYPRQVSRATKSFDRMWSPNPPPEERPLAVEELDSATRDEFGFALTDMLSLQMEIMNIGYGIRGPTKAMPLDTLVDSLTSALKWDANRVRSAIELLGLTPRENFLEPPNPYVKEDAYPWRFNRELSYVRKPLIWRRKEKTWEIVWGNRHVHLSGQNLLNLCLYGRLKARSKSMKSYIAHNLKDAGLAFNNKVANVLSERPRVRVERRVKKIAGELIGGAATPLGDIDVLAFDHDRREILAIECKALALARTPRELANELGALFVGKHGKDSAAERHLKRAKWLELRIDKVLEYFKIPTKGKWKIVPSIVVDEEPMSSWIRESPMPVVPLSQLEGTA